MEHIGVGSNKGRRLNNTEEERQQPVAVHVVDGCMVGLTMEEAQQSFFFYSTANSNHSKDGDSIKFLDKKAESFLCNKSTAQLYVARHRGFPLYVYIECLQRKEFIRRLPRSRELEVREREREPNTDLRLEILAEFLPQSAAIAETLSGARWLTSASADVTHEIIGGGGGAIAERLGASHYRVIMMV